MPEGNRNKNVRTVFSRKQATVGLGQGRGHESDMRDSHQWQCCEPELERGKAGRLGGEPGTLVKWIDVGAPYTWNSIINHYNSWWFSFKKKGKKKLVKYFKKVIRKPRNRWNISHQHDYTMKPNPYGATAYNIIIITGMGEGRNYLKNMTQLYQRRLNSIIQFIHIIAQIYIMNC